MPRLCGFLHTISSRRVYFSPTPDLFSPGHCGSLLTHRPMTILTPPNPLLTADQVSGHSPCHGWRPCLLLPSVAPHDFPLTLCASPSSSALLTLPTLGFCACYSLTPPSLYHSFPNSQPSILGGFSLSVSNSAYMLSHHHHRHHRKPSWTSLAGPGASSGLSEHPRLPETKPAAHVSCRRAGTMFYS